MKALSQTPLHALAQPVASSTRLLDKLHHIDWPELATEWGVRIGGALVVLFIGMWLAKTLGRLLSRLLARFGVDGILTSFLGNIVRAIVLIVVFIATLDYVGIPTTSLLAVVGAAGLGIGLALKDSLSNIASGVMLIVLRPFRAGDQVQVASLNGIVEHVRIFQTVLRTFDNRVMILPNSLITTAPITNFTARDTRRVDLTIGIGYDDNIGHARTTLIAAAHANPRVLVEPTPDVLVSELAESSVNLILRAWVATNDYGVAKSELTEAARNALGAGGISIPFPQRDLHVFHHGTLNMPEPKDLLDAGKDSKKPTQAVAVNDVVATGETPES
ncbi:MAG: mechanosensitive ion channel family protein [Lysobacteraceae bacterium]